MRLICIVNLFILPLSVFATSSADLASSSLQCSTLAVLLPGKVSFPGSSNYTASIQSYFFVSARLEPTCVVSPSCTQDVSVVVKALGTLHKLNPAADFAVRSGGHSPNPGAANIQPGVTIDLRGINEVMLSSDKKVVSLGGGAIWGNVYAQLSKNNLTVLGGRDSGVGVGGLLTGGGLSFLSPLHGFACDNVVNFEIVLASGEIVNANASSHSDLFRALKGGSSNFGIVTRFDVYAYASGSIFGGAILYPPSADAAQLSAYVTYKNPAKFDPYAENELSFLYDSATNTSSSANIMYYGKPILNPPALQPFINIQPQSLSLTGITTISDLSIEVHSFQPTNDQGVFATTTIQTSPALLTTIYDLYKATLPAVAGVTNLTYVIVFQSLPKNVDGNSLGLTGDTQNLTIVLLSHFWSNAADSPLVLSVTENLINQIDAASKAVNAFNPYKYLNYAALFEDPLASYGQTSLNFLRAVSTKYDPAGLFQTGVPGGFKLNRA